MTTPSPADVHCNRVALCRAATRCVLLLGAAMLGGFCAAAHSGEPRHAIAMHGEPALPAGFTRLPYADPAAPKGGRLVQGVLGTFDSLNPLIAKGVWAQGIALRSSAAAT